MPADMILSHCPLTGVYYTRFWVNGQWHLIETDDRVPVHLSTKSSKYVPTYAESFVEVEEGDDKAPQPVYLPILEKMSSNLS